MIQTRQEYIETEIADAAVTIIKPLVSVLMVTYNHSAYLAEAIEGVVSQKADFSIELIIGEDCSTDNSRAIALEYQRRYPHIIRVVYSNQNVGGCQNLTRCFAKVRGEFVAYCEGDDYWHDPLKLQKQVDFMRANPDYAAVHSDYDRIIYTFGSWRRVTAINHSKREKIPQGDIYIQLLNSKAKITSCTFMGRSSLLRHHASSKVNSHSYPVGDLPIKLHMSKLGKIGYIDESLGTYRRTEGSVMNSGSRSKLSMRKRMISIYQDFAREFGASESEWLDVQRTYYRAVWISAVRACSRKEAIAAWEWLRKNDPNFAMRLKNVLWTYLTNVPWLLMNVLRLRTFIREVVLLLKSQKVG